MSWMQLLATSRSINAAKDGPTRYKMAEQNLLPKFPVTRRGVNVAASEAPARVTAAPMVEPVAPARLQTASLFDFNPNPVAPVSSTSIPEPAQSPIPAAATTPLPPIPSAPVAEQKPSLEKNPFAIPVTKEKKSRWSLFATFFVRRRRKNRNGQMIQGEWVLDQVTVVRNDLSDADLEVVAGKATAAQASKRESISEALSKLTTRFQKTEREERLGGRETAAADAGEIKFSEMAIRS